jgi:hypothetical protein
MSTVAVIAEINVSVNQKTAFEVNVPIDLTSIFTGFGLLPAVVGVKNQTGSWNGAGQTRTVLLSDGSSGQEKLTKYEHPDYFSYTISGFTNMFRFLITSIDGEWWFSRVTSDETHIKWRYAFKAKSVFTVPVLWFIGGILWRGYMGKILRLFKTQVEHAVT